MARLLRGWRVGPVPGLRAAGCSGDLLGMKYYSVMRGLK